MLFHNAATSAAVMVSWVLSGFPLTILATSYCTDPSRLAELVKDDVPRIVGLQE